MKAAMKHDVSYIKKNGNYSKGSKPGKKLFVSKATYIALFHFIFINNKLL